MKRERENRSGIRERPVGDIQRLAAISDENDVFSSLARMLKRGVRSSWIAVYLLDRDAHGFLPPLTFGLTEKLLPAFREMPLMPGRERALRNLLARRKQILLPDPSRSEMPAASFLAIMAAFSLLAVPMNVRQQLQGFILLGRPRRLHPFSQVELSTIREMVSQASLVASNIRLANDSLDLSIDMAKRIDTILTLDEINKAISSSLSHERIIATAAERIEGLVLCDLQTIAVMRGDSLEVTSTRCGELAVPEGLAPGSLLKNQGVVRRALSSKEIQYIPDTLINHQPCVTLRNLMKSGIRSLMAVPLMTSQGVKGLLVLGDRTPEQFQGDELFAIEKIASQLAVALENARLYEEMRQLFFSTVASLANAIDAKSPWTKGHSLRVMNVAANIARDMGLSEEGVERVRLGGLLHDIGKIGVMEALLEKPEELDDEEFPPLRLHPEKGVAILEPIEQLKDVLPGILHHHEFFDGSGYPGGLAGDAIPLDARIIALADSFDAMIADRPYKKGMGVMEASAEMMRCAGTQFDPEIVDCFRSRLAKLVNDTAT